MTAETDWLELLCAASQDALLAIDGAGHVMRLSVAGAALFEREAASAVGLPVAALLPELEDDDAIARETVAVTGGGQRFPVRVTTRTGVAAGAPVRVASVRDLRELRRVEDALRDAQRIDGLGMLAGGVAHDFNNFLTSIVGSADLTRRCLPPDHPALVPLADVVRASERAVATTRRLLAYAGRGEARPGAADLNEVVTDIVSLLRSSLPPGVSVEVDLAPDLPILWAERGHLQQVVMNLVLNAAEASAAARTAVHVRTRRSVGAVELVVADAGVGIPSDVVPRIFDPFFTTKAHGRGLGLAAVASMARARGGTVDVASEVGVGTTFRVVLPSGAISTVPAAERAPVPPRRRGVRILVVDDDDDLQEYVGAVLSLQDHVANVAGSGEAALAIADLTSFDLAFVDIVLSGMDGFEAAAHLRARAPTLPIVMMSGYGDDLSGDPRLVAGARVLAKPFSPAELLGMVDVMAR